MRNKAAAMGNNSDKLIASNCPHETRRGGMGTSWSMLEVFPMVKYLPNLLDKKHVLHHLPICLVFGRNYLVVHESLIEESH